MIQRRPRRAVTFSHPHSEGGIFAVPPSEYTRDKFLRLLGSQRIEVLADVRSSVSDTCDPFFQRSALYAALSAHGIAYKAFTPLTGVDWIVESVGHWRIALLCGEQIPSSSCHSSVMSQMLAARGVSVHPLPDVGGDQERLELIEIFSIGVTGNSALVFFGKLMEARIKRLLDVRLNNWTQLAGFTTRDDLPFFLKELCDAEYVHEPLLAPTRELLNDYKIHGGDWNRYEQDFLALIA